MIVFQLVQILDMYKTLSLIIKFWFFDIYKTKHSQQIIPPKLLKSIDFPHHWEQNQLHKHISKFIFFNSIPPFTSQSNPNTTANLSSIQKSLFWKPKQPKITKESIFYLYQYLKSRTHWLSQTRILYFLPILHINVLELCLFNCINKISNYL